MRQVTFRVGCGFLKVETLSADRFRERSAAAWQPADSEAHSRPDRARRWQAPLDQPTAKQALVADASILSWDCHRPFFALTRTLATRSVVHNTEGRP